MVYILHPAVLSLPYSLQAPSGRWGSPFLEVPSENLELNALVFEGASGKEYSATVAAKGSNGKVDAEVAADNGSRVLLITVRNLKCYRDVQEPQVFFAILLVDNLRRTKSEDLGIEESLHTFGIKRHFLPAADGADRNAALREAVVPACTRSAQGTLNSICVQGWLFDSRLL